MEGITILNTIEGTIWTDGTAILFFVLMIGGLIGSLISLFLLDWNVDCGVAMFAISVAVFLSGVIVAFCGPKKPYIKYQVLVDESVSMTEFHNKYTLLEHDGEIYTIIEKELSK